MGLRSDTKRLSCVLLQVVMCVRPVSLLHCPVRAAACAHRYKLCSVVFPVFLSPNMCLYLCVTMQRVMWTRPWAWSPACTRRPARPPSTCK